MIKDFQKGTVSVFLVLILVPCIAISSLFVDISRVQLGKSVAVSSADLALNSLMAHYDKDLSEIYGMMASCQNIEEFYEESAQFFLDALYSQGLEQDDIDSLIAMYSAVVGDDTVYDLLQLEAQTETSNIISAVEGASLGESSILIKDQIVDFMKYRGPIEIASGIIERLKSNNVAETLTQASKNEELVKDKQDYAEAVGDLLEACYKSYVYLDNYDRNSLSYEELQEIYSLLKDYREIYRELNAEIISNFMNTSDLARFSRPVYAIDTYNSTYPKTSKKVYSSKKTENGVTTYYVDGKDIKSADGEKGIIPELEEKIDEFVDAKKNLVNATNEWRNLETGNSGNQTNEIQWWVKINDAINVGNNSYVEKYKTAAENMLKMYSKMLGMMDCEAGEGIPENWKQECETLKQEVEALQQRYLIANFTDNNDAYLKLVKRLETISANNIGKIQSSTHTLSNGKTIGTTVSEISVRLDGYKTRIKELLEFLDIVINGNLFKGVKSLDRLKSLVQEYESTFENWEGTANRINTSASEEMADEDLADIEIERSKYDDITEASVDELKQRLLNIKEVLQDVVNDIDSVKYGSKKIVDIDTYSKVYDAIKGKVDKKQIGLKNSELETYAEQIFSQVFVPYSANSSDAVASLAYNNSVAHDPNLNNDTPELYKYWKEQYKGKTAEDIQSQQDEVNGGKSDAADKKDEINNKDRTEGTDISKINIYGNEEYVSSEFPSGLDASTPYKLGTSILQTFGSLAESITSGNYTNIRDSLYATEYVMDMFSYATYSNEGKNKLYLKLNEDAVLKDSEVPVNTEEIKTAWESVKLTDTYNKTLTNKMINSANNVAYGAEVEYVLYGDTNKKNVASAYADIFAIRYPLNLVSGFQNFWTASPDDSPTSNAQVIYTISFGVQTATQGIIPMFVTKPVLIALLAVFETANDLERLQNGVQVELYKKEEDWRMTLNGWTPNANGEDKENTSGLYYSDYIYLFLYLGFESESAPKMYLRVGDLVQANMRVRTGVNTYGLKNSKTYFKLNATIKAKPLMLNTAYALQYSNNPKDKIEWCTFNVSEIRGYS